MTPVDLTEYDLIIVNSSGGKDSQAMLDYLAELAEERRAEAADGRRRGLHMVVAHADLGRIEWQGTRELAEEQAAHYGLPFEAITRPQGDLLVQIRQRAEKRPDVAPWPDSKNRYCTASHKRDQIAKLVTKWTAQLQQNWGIEQPRILNCMGIRAQESPARAKKVPFQRNERLTNGKRVVDDWYPIFEWTEDEVWARIRASGVRYHWAYDEGMPRLSCAFCVFAPRAALIIAGRHNRALLDEYVAIERDTGWTFRHKFSLEDVAAAVDRGEQGEITDQEACGWNM